MKTYALIGDSHTQVVFPFLEDILMQQGNQVVVSKPMAGWTMKKHLQDGLSYLISNAKPDVLLISLGGNNQNLSNSYMESINAIMQIAKENNIKEVIWVSPAWAIRDDVQIRHEWTSNFLKANLPKRVRFIDIRPITKDGHRSDGVHFTREKYREWANYVAQKINYGLAITSIPTWTWYVSGGFVILSLGIYLWKKNK